MGYYHSRISSSRADSRKASLSSNTSEYDAFDLIFVQRNECSVLWLLSLEDQLDSS